MNYRARIILAGELGPRVYIWGVLTRRLEMGRSYTPSRDRTFLLPPDDIEREHRRVAAAAVAAERAAAFSPRVSRSGSRRARRVGPRPWLLCWSVCARWFEEMYLLEKGLVVYRFFGKNITERSWMMQQVRSPNECVGF